MLWALGGSDECSKDPPSTLSRGRWVCKDISLSLQHWQTQKLLSPVESGAVAPSVQFSSVQSLSCVRLLVIHESQHTRPPCPSPTPGVHPDSCPSSQWCHQAISSSAFPFSSCPQSLPASESFPRSQLFTWGGLSTGVSALASFLPKKSEGWSPSEWTGWISLQSKGLSRVFSNTTVQKHQFFSTRKRKGKVVVVVRFQSLGRVQLLSGDPMDCSTPGSSVLHYLPYFVQIHVHWVGDAI